MASIDWLTAELGRLDVTIQTETELDAEAMRASAAEVVVLATGARAPAQLLDPGDGSIPIITIDEALEGDHAGARIVMVDHRGMEEGALAAESLARAGAMVTLTTPMASIGTNIGFTRIREHLLRLYGAGCELLPSTQVNAIADGRVLTRHVHSRAPGELPADLIVASVAFTPDLSLRDAAWATGAEVLLAGDSMAPRTAMHAFREGDAAGRAA
jgi:hypothetical protein